MRRISLALLLCVTLFTAQAQDHKTPVPVITTPEALSDALLFKEMEYNFGDIAQGKPVYHSFLITNSGKTAIKLTDVHASCGCTTPEWSREEIAPGATAPIKVGYNAATAGHFDKTITVSYNNQTKILRIKGEVWKAPEGSAPANAGVDFLKKQTL